jgi:hypothetical protein
LAKQLSRRPNASSVCAKAALEDAGGQAVTGYRAPSFSIDTRTPWAHAVLAEAGYAYSSSVAPVSHDHYGWAQAPRALHRPVAGAELIEWPITLAKVLGREVSTAGASATLGPSNASNPRPKPLGFLVTIFFFSRCSYKV